MPAPFDEPDDEEPDAPMLAPYDGIEVEVTDNLVIGTFYAVDGSVLIEITEREVIAFGYQSGT